MHIGATICLMHARVINSTAFNMLISIKVYSDVSVDVDA